MNPPTSTPPGAVRYSTWLDLVLVDLRRSDRVLDRDSLLDLAFDKARENGRIAVSWAALNELLDRLEVAGVIVRLEGSLFLNTSYLAERPPH